MGDPAHFSVRGGANPHTRNAFGLRKRVRADRAIAQWHALARTLTGLGVRVFVIPAHPECTGLVYPANAGFLPEPIESPPHARLYLLSRLIPSRAAETPVYRDFLSALGFAPVQAGRRFEGEADFFPVAGTFVLTTGRIERQRFVPRLGFPPWRRVYGFRTEAAEEAELASLVAPRAVLRLALHDERYYHGDTVLCSFGLRREHLLAWLPGLTAESHALITKHHGPRIIPIDRADAEVYAANSFGLMSKGKVFLVMPEGVSARLLAAVSERGVRPVCVDVSEFLKKGGGSVKCMIGDLGEMADDEGLLPPEVARFRREHDYRTLYPNFVGPLFEGDLRSSMAGTTAASAAGRSALG
jgi:N-dimethylarginine dimethylaminohydrolase